MSAQAAQRDVISRHGARKKVYIPGYRGCIQHMQETQFGTFGDSAQAAYRMAEGRGKGPGRESAVYCTADALYHPDPDARYKTNKGNQSHIMFGDDRDWDMASVQNVKFKRLRQEPLRRAPIVDGWATFNRLYIDKAYQTALKRVGEVGLAGLVQAIQDKVRQRTSGGSFALRRAFKNFDRDGSGDIDLDEFFAAMDSFGLQFDEDQVLALFGHFDKDCAGTLNYDQLISQVLERVKGPPAPVLHPIPASPLATMHFVESKRASIERVRQMFALYDHRSGRIETKELRLLLDQLGFVADPDKLAVALEQLDPTQSGEVSWETFKGWWGYVCSLKGEASPLVPSLTTIKPSIKQYPRRDRDEIPDRATGAILSPMLRVPSTPEYPQPKIRPSPLVYKPLSSLPGRALTPPVCLEGQHRRASVFPRAQSRQAARDNCIALNSGALARCRTGFRTTGLTHIGGNLLSSD